MDEKDLPGYDSSLSALCRRVEETAGLRPTTPLEFDEMTSAILRRTGERLSPTTLKRLWGYLNEPVNPREKTLDILAQCCGWISYQDFRRGESPEIESGAVGTPVINARSDMKRGERLLLMWPPGRVCEIEYEGDARWRVIASEGTRISAGDTFVCSMIVRGQPMYLDDLRRPDAKPCVYVCGRKSGVKFERIGMVGSGA
ncbi:MAG: hypothetical protein K2M31_00190 [Muribaculaceae bacterium]|nr:hypothetical protein [Muribaculaceae bacterium]